MTITRFVHRIRPAWIAASLLLVSLVTLAGIAIIATAEGEAPTFRGTDFGADLAPDFRLTNQFGQPIALSEQRGKVVVLTFLYTDCPDICPLTAARLRQVYEQLGDDAEDVTFLAVSVDPERDTAEAAFAFSERFDMLDRWSYLVGSPTELEPIWQAYYIGVLPDPRARDQVMHTAPLYLIDQSGRRRSLHTTGGETDAIIGEVVHDIRILLDEAG